MDLTWISVIDTAVKIGFGALITATSGYLVLVKTQSHEESKELKERFYKLQDEKKSKYVELLAQSQELVQSHLFIASEPGSEAYKLYLRTFNEVQIISNDEIRAAAFNMMSDVSNFITLRKHEQETALVDSMVKSSREKVSIFQKIAQLEVTKCYQRT
jgi:hypothetical protein